MSSSTSKTTQQLSDAGLLNAFNEAYSQTPENEAEELLLELTENAPRYNTSHYLNEGGAKCIFSSYDQITGRTLARAFPRDHCDTASFLWEARLNARLQHPNILPIYDIALDNDKPYFSMKLVEGQTLNELINDFKKNTSLHQASSRNKLLDIFLKVCDAIAYAHSQGVIHLDLKPENIHVSSYGEVLVGDWGTARILEDRCPDINLQVLSVNNSEILRPTLQGYIKGTPGFMAPEQCHAEGIKREASDIYSLGILLFFMLYGTEPNTGKNTQELIHNTLIGHLNFTALDKSGIHIPEALQCIVTKATALSPAQRYASVSAIIDDIQAFRNGFLTSVEPKSFYRQASKLYNRHKTVSLVSFSSLGLIFTLILVFIINLHKSETRASEALQNYHIEKQQKDLVRKSLAKQYLEKSSQLYFNATAKGHRYNPELNIKAYANIIRAVELNPNLEEAWAIKGQLHIFMEQFELAIKAFARAGKEHQIYSQTLQNFLQTRFDKKAPLSTEEHLQLLQALKSTRNLRLLNDITFKVIFSDLKLEEHLWFIQEALKFHHNYKSISFEQGLNFHFNEERMALDLSDNKGFWILYPIKNILLRELDLSGTAINYDLRHIAKMPLRVLNLANTPIRNIHMRSLANKPIHTLSLRNCAVSKLDTLKSLELKKLDISGTQCTHYHFLNSCGQLEEIIISPHQEKGIRKTLKNLNVKIIVRGST